MDEPEHAHGEKEVHEEREIPPKDPTEKMFDDLLSMMKTIVDQMWLQRARDQKGGTREGHRAWRKP